MTKTSNIFRTPATLLSLLILTGCFYDESLDETLPEDTVVSYSLDIQPIFDNNCISCHPLIVSPPDLTEDNSYDAVISNNYIVPKDLDASILYQKLKGNPNIMPPSGPLPKKEIDLVKEWIEQGALNN